MTYWPTEIFHFFFFLKKRKKFLTIMVSLFILCRLNFPTIRLMSFYQTSSVCTSRPTETGVHALKNEIVVGPNCPGLFQKWINVLPYRLYMHVETYDTKFT